MVTILFSFPFYSEMSFAYLNEDEIDSELKCSICSEPFQSPLNCKSCGNTYCQQCINNWLKQQSSCPSCRRLGSTFAPVITRVVINQLNRLLVQCELCEQKNLQRSNFSDHLNYHCPKKIVSCPDGCSWQGERIQLDKHVRDCRQKTNSIACWVVLFILFISMILYWNK